MMRPKITITHHDVQPPQYDLEALKHNITDCDRHIAMLQAEIDKQRVSKKELKRLIKEQEKRNSHTPGR